MTGKMIWHQIMLLVWSRAMQGNGLKALKQVTVKKGTKVNTVSTAFKVINYECKESQNSLVSHTAID